MSGYQVQVIYCTFSNALIQVFTKDLLQQYFLMHYIGVFLFYFMKKKILCEHFPFNLTLRKRKQSLVPKDLLVQWLADFLLKKLLLFSDPIQFNSLKLVIATRSRSIWRFCTCDIIIIMWQILTSWDPNQYASLLKLKVRFPKHSINNASKQMGLMASGVIVLLWCCLGFEEFYLISF